MVSSFNTRSFSNPNCQYCRGIGCLFCKSERQKAERARQEAEQRRTERLKSMMPEEIFAELPTIRQAIQIAAQIKGITLTPEELEEQARSEVLQNLARGGHEYPIPKPIFTCDGSEIQLAELREVFHFDQLTAASADGGFAAIEQHAKAVMDRRHRWETVEIADLFNEQNQLSGFCWQQAWAAALFYAGKNIDNRNSRTHKRGNVLVYATVGKQQLQASLKTMHDRGLSLPEETKLVHGALLGVVEIYACTDHTQSDEWVGDWGMPRSWHWHVRNPRLFPQPIPYRPQSQGWFWVTPETIANQQSAGITYSESLYRDLACRSVRKQKP